MPHMPHVGSILWLRWLSPKYLHACNGIVKAALVSLNKPFNMAASINLAGKTFLVTGGNSGTVIDDAKHLIKHWLRT